MKKIFKGYVVGFLSAVILILGITAFATSTTTLYDVITDGIRIVLDGKEFTCTDANGAVVQPMIYNGTTYIPVRAVSSAFGKAVYWDGEENTVYLGNMDGKLEKPTLKLEDIENIAENAYFFKIKNNIFDNYGNFYDTVARSSLISTTNNCCETLLDGKYSKFKATLFVPEGSYWNDNRYIKIIGDGKVIYSSGEMNKTSEPVDIEVSVVGINNFKIIFADYDEGINIANGGFYQ